MTQKDIFGNETKFFEKASFFNGADISGGLTVDGTVLGGAGISTTFITAGNINVIQDYAQTPARTGVITSYESHSTIVQTSIIGHPDGPSGTISIAPNIQVTGDVTATGQITAPGMILQTSFFTSTRRMDNTDVRTYEVIHSGVVTAISANSRYLVNGYAHGYSSSTSSRSNIGFGVTIGATQYLIAGAGLGVGQGVDTWGHSAYSGAVYARQAVWDPSGIISVPAGTTMTFNLLGGSYDAEPTWNYPGYGHKSALTVQEIAT